MSGYIPVVAYRTMLTEAPLFNRAKGIEAEHISSIIFSLSSFTPWPEAASELYRPSDRHLSAKLVATFAT
jgi:hypothetical protein